MNKKLLLITLICIVMSTAFSSNVQAQTKYTVKGTVVDAQKNPIIGASVVETGTSNGVSTNVSGEFRLEVSSGSASVSISGLGYKLISYAANSNVFASPVVLVDDNVTLDDVVVIGYGKVRRSDATGSVLSLKPDQMNKGSQVTAQDALVGKLAGVNITPGGGAPGEGATIRIRGGSSLSASNDPLVIIDGVPVDNSSIAGSSNILSTINPNDIEAFNVLKDASATAIYGSRASNGVIIITTKRGKLGSSKPVFNYNNNFTVSSVTKTIDVLSADEYRTYLGEQFAGQPSVISGLGSASTDWQKAIYRTAFGHEHNFSINGSTKTMPYRVSLGYTNQDGVIKTNSYERLTAGVSLNPTFFKDHLSASFNVKGSYENNHDIENSVVGSAISFDPTRSIYTSEDAKYGLGYFMWLSESGSPLTIAANNPVAELMLRDKTTKVKRSIGNAAFDYKVHGLEDLRFNLNLGYDILQSDGKELIPDNAPMMYTTNKKDGQGLDRNFTQNKRNTLLDFYANYNKEIGKHRLDLMAGYGWQHFWKSYEDKRMNRTGQELFAPVSYETENYLVSFYGRLNYSYNSKYLLTATYRADASSRFAKENRWGYFPSAALAWRISQEDFLKHSTVVSDLKLRLSYGQTGQQDIGSDYPYMSTYTASTPGADYQFGDSWYTTYRADGYDPNIRWESTETYNLGIDYGFLNGRINGSIDLYKRKTTDLLNRIPTAAGSNLASEIYTNVGSMSNKGIEFAINTVPVSTKNWRWDLNFNITYDKSKITKLNTIDSDNYGVMTGPISGTGKTAQIHAVGFTPYTFYLAQQAYDENGVPLDGKYIQADGSVGDKDSHRVKSKSAMPDFYYGISTKVTYKSWDLGINGHGSKGNYIYNFGAADDYQEHAYQANFYSNILTSTRDKGFKQQRLYSDYFLEDGSFFRVDNITLGYTFKRVFKDGISLRVNASVQNPFVITNYSGLDPESFYRGDDNATYRGIDRNFYPRPRIYMMGLNLNF